MLEAITWKQFLAVAASVVVVYYFIIGLLYYRKNLKNILKRKKKGPGSNSGRDQQQREINKEINDEVMIDPFYEELVLLVGKIRRILVTAGKGANKAELLMQISTILANYGGLRQLAYRTALNNFIVNHAEDICGVTFDEGELDEEWERLPR